MTEEKKCSRCGECCKVLPLFTQHMHPDFRKYLLTRGMKEDKEQGCILIPHVCQHLLPEAGLNTTIDQRDGQNEIAGLRLNSISMRCKYTGNYTCAIHDSPDRPDICRKYHGQRIMKNARIYVPPACAFRRDP